MNEDKITKYLMWIIILLIITIITIIITKTVTKNKEMSCNECEACEKYEPYKEYLNNLTKEQKYKFAYTKDTTYALMDENKLYAILDKSNPLYKSLKGNYEDIPGYCDVEKCEQGVKVTDKEIVDIFHVKQGKKDIALVLDTEGKLYYINQAEDNFELKETEYKDIVNVYNPNDSYIIQAIDIRGNIHYINLDNLS